MPASQQYEHKALNNRAGKWRDIALTNLVDDIPVEEIDELHDRLKVRLETQRQARIDRLTELKAPRVIMDQEHAALEKIRQGKDPVLRILVRSKNRRIQIA